MTKEKTLEEIKEAFLVKSSPLETLAFHLLEKIENKILNNLVVSYTCLRTLYKKEIIFNECIFLYKKKSLLYEVSLDKNLDLYVFKSKVADIRNFIASYDDFLAVEKKLKEVL